MKTRVEPSFVAASVSEPTRRDRTATWEGLYAPTEPHRRPLGARLHSALLATCALVCLGLALSGCAKRTPTDAAAADQVLRISQRNEPADLDPATATLPDEFFVIRALSEGLLVPNPAGGDPRPAAAERYSVSPDGLTYTFQLRPATWSNGDPVTANDFAASFHRVLSPVTAATKAHLFFAVKNAEAFASGRLSDFSRVGFRVIDAHTLAVTLERPTPRFPLYVASGAWIPVHAPTVAQYGRTWTEPGHFVGNGPFLLTEWRPQQRIVVRRNPQYRDATRVHLAEIQFIRFDNQESEERAFRAGQIDVTMAVPQPKLEVYARDRADELHQAPLAETRFLAFNTTRSALGDARVRRALSLAIDRHRVAAQVLKGGQFPAERFLSPALLHASADAGAPIAEVPPASRHSFDPTTAQRLFAEAGFPGGAGFPRLELSGWAQNPVLEAIQQMWRQTLGIEVQIVVREAKVHLAALHTGSYDIAFVTNLLDVRDPVSALSDFTSRAPNNFPHWSSAPFDAAIDEAATTPDQSAATRLLLDAERTLLDAAPVAPIYFNTQNWLMSPRVKGWQQDALWTRHYVDLRLEPAK